MYRFLKISGILLLFHISCFAQKEITIEWKNDTAWYVNPDFDLFLLPTYDVTLKTPVKTIPGYTHFKIDWGDESALSEIFVLAQENTIRHTYVSPGLYDLKIHLYSDATILGNSHIICKKIMNRSLAANFKLEPENSRRCMEWGGDSILVVLFGNDNPPGTNYEIKIDSDVEKAGVVVKNAFETKWFGQSQDSAWIIAKEPTGTFGARVGLQVSYNKNVEMEVPPLEWKSFFVYKTPDLKDIYHFADTLINGQPYPYLEVCASEVVPQMWQDSLRLMKYQYRTAFNPAVTPYYKSINNKEAFQVDYFWTEDVPDEQTTWLMVTSDPEYVDTTKVVRLKKAGYYKVRISAYNQCGYDLNGSELLRVDSLWTDSLRDSPDKRYFRVYEQAVDRIVCLEDSVCGKQVVFVDKNTRHNYDVVADYTLSVTLLDGSEVPSNNYTIHRETYLDGRVIDGENNWLTMGCDSTIVKVTFQDWGIYQINLTRSTTACDDIEKDFTVYLGATPASYASIIENKLNAEYGVLYDEGKQIYEKCDSFRYYLQRDLWTKNTFDVDSVYFYFQKGNVHLDTIFGDEKDFYDFDSVGNQPNKIRVSAHNFCGWKEIETEFYTRTKPNVILWRDGLPDNDSLCLNIAYDYEVVGILPEHALVKYQANKSVYVDGELQQEFQIKEIPNYQGEKISVKNWQLGTMQEGIIVINSDMPVCTQIYKDTLYTITAPDTLIVRDTVRYCERLEEISTENLFRPGEHAFKWAEWRWNEEAVEREKLPVFHYTSAKTDSLQFKLSNSTGCYISGKLFFEPQSAPKLLLKETSLVCMPDTLRDYTTAEYVLKLEQNGAEFYVYNGWVAENALLCRYGGVCNELPLVNLPYDRLPLIYILETPITEGFSAGCYLEDTVNLLLRQPRLEITKDDTVRGSTYDFSVLARYIDSAHLDQTHFEWTTISGGNNPELVGPDHLLDWQYTLTSPDQEGKILTFQLTAKTVCGDEIVDTLNVVVPHVELEGYIKTICPDNDYLLWPEVKSAFVDETSLQWKICYPDNPALQGLLTGVGSEATYNHPLGVISDSIRIYVEGTFSYGTEKVGDTIVLKIGTYHEEPELVLAHHKDTLCRTENEIELLRNWLTVTPGLYEDSLLLNGNPFRQNLSYHTSVLPGTTDTLIFSVDIHGCIEFKGKSVDTLFLYRLPAMITEEFQVSSGCETAVMPIGLPENLLHTLTVSHTWQGWGGDVTVENAAVSFTPECNGDGMAALTLYARPPHGCEVDTLRKDFPVYRLPEVTFKKDTVCRVEGQIVTIPVDVAIEANRNGVDKIQWYRKGEVQPFTVTSGASDLNFNLSAQDVATGFVDVVAKILPLAPCLSVAIYDTIRISLWDQPEMIMRQDPLAICQGEDFDLSSVVEIKHAADTLWTLMTSDAGNVTLDRYNSGGYWGNVTFKVQLGGQYGCVAKEQLINANVKYAPQPSIHITEPLCQQDSIHFEAQTVTGTNPEYTWKFDETEQNIAGKKVLYAFEEAGNCVIYLNADYNGCLRTLSLPVTIHPKPEAIFEIGKQVAIGRETTLVSKSRPSGVVCDWSFENDLISYSDSIVNYIFEGEVGKRNVLLKVTTQQGCSDTVSHSTMAVKLPVADFRLKVDSCTGRVQFVNQSIRNGADFSWEFGNGDEETDLWNPEEIQYERTFSDTIYYATLTLTNIAGHSTKTLPVKLVSKLKADAVVLPLTDGCNKSEKEVHILTKGVADTTRLWWGDGSEELWTRDQSVVLRRHRYENLTTEIKYFSLVVQVKNKCEQDELSPSAVPIHPVTEKVRVILNEDYTNECMGEVRGFENKSVGFLPSGYVCEWQFEKEGELLTDNNNKVTHIFERPGIYWVKLSVRDNCNAGIDSVKVTVHGNDSLRFAVDSKIICTEQQLLFKLVQYGETAFSNLCWNFSDGTEEHGQEVTYSPQQSGKCYVTLSAVADGCPVVYKDSLQVHESPKAWIEPVTSRGCLPFPLTLKGKNLRSQEVKVLWDFHDNTSASLFELTKTFEKEGDYRATLQLTTEEGCTDSVSLPVTVLHSPEVDIMLREKFFCTDEGNFEVVAVQTGTESPERCTFGWWCGDELVSLDPDSARFEFRQFIGKAGVKLVVTDKYTNCQVVKTDTVIASPKVKAAMQTIPADFVCLGEPVVFETPLTDEDQACWDFGDGTTVKSVSTEHLYTAAGVYPVRLSVRNKYGCADSTQFLYRVESLPVAAFNWENTQLLTGLPDTLILPDKPTGGIRFINESYYPGGEKDELSFRWTFGDQTPGTQDVSPSHNFKNNGNYEVWLYATTPQGCVDSLNDWVHISALKGLFLPNAFVPAVSDEGVARFQPKGIGLSSYKIAVYDKWGTCVWSSEKLTDGRPVEYWDGTFKQQPLAKGMYLWKVNAVFLDGTVWSDVSGYVNLIR